jgi:dethiobiotin synthetase
MPDDPGPAEQSAPHQIGSLCGAPVLGVWPYRESDCDIDLVDELADWLGGQTETGIVLRELGI